MAGIAALLLELDSEARSCIYTRLCIHSHIWGLHGMHRVCKAERLHRDLLAASTCCAMSNQRGHVAVAAPVTPRGATATGQSLVMRSMGDVWLPNVGVRLLAGPSGLSHPLLELGPKQYSPP